MARLIERLVDFLWTTIAAILIAAAAIVAGVRLLLPEIDTQRVAIETWLSATIGRPAVVGSIDASWSGWAPQVGVERLAILDPSGGEELVHFDRATINIAPLASLLALTLKPKSLILTGVQLTLIRHADGHFSVAGMPPPKSPILQWLLGQDNFAVTEAELTVIDERGGASFALSGVKLTVRNQGPNKAITAFVDLPDAIGERLVLDFVANASPLTPDWDGTLNLRIDGLRSGFLLEHLALPAVPPSEVAFNLVAWSAWQDGGLASSDFRLDVLHSPAGAGAANVLVGARGRLEKRRRGWRADFTDIDLPVDGIAGERPRASVAWDRSGDGPPTVVARAEQLPLRAITALLDALLPLTPEQRETLAGTGATGIVNQFEVAWAGAAAGRARFRAEAEFASLELRPGTVAPGVNGLAGRLVLTPEQGALVFAGTDFTLAQPARLVHPLAVEGLAGMLTWRMAAGHPHLLEAHNLRATVEGTALTLSGGLELLPDSAPIADLELSFATDNGADLHALIPRGLLPENGERWVREIIQSGRIKDGRARLQGPLTGLPIDSDAGGFAFDLDVEQAILRYSRNWPIATGIDGHLALRERALSFKVAAGSVSGASVAGAEISVPDLFTPKRVARISGTARGPARSATDIVLASPLKAGRAARLTELAIDGDIAVTLDINLALYAGGPREILGQAHFDGNRITARTQKITLENVVGTVGFTRGDWYGEGITAEFEDTPVGLVVNGGLDDPNYDSEFRMTATSSVPRLLAMIERYAPPLHDWLVANDELAAFSGNLPWKAVLTIPRRPLEGSALPQRLILESSLQGFGVDLPWPFGKPDGERRPLRIETAIADHVAVATRIDFGEMLNVEIDAERSTDGSAAVTRVEALFGATTPVFTGTPGISMSGRIARLPLGEWSRFLNRAGPDGSATRNRLAQRFDVEVEDLDLLGRSFNAIRLRGELAETHWNIDVSGESASGQITVPRDAAAEPLVLTLERLHLAPTGAPVATATREPALPAPPEPSRDTLDPRRLPAVVMRCASFKFGKADFGRAEITTSRRPEGQRIEHIGFKNPDFSIDAKGNWLMIDGAQDSHFDIDVRSVKLAALLQRFGYTAANIEDGRTQITINANWPGPPSHFTLERMNGNFELHVTDGRLLDIEPGGGRLFGLLSVATLPRRLILDFDDLFRKGFTFDKLDGVFEIDSGNAYTNGLVMEGPSARIDLSGRTGLAAKDYDQHVVVTPALANTLPMAGALFGPVGVGAGAVYFLGQKMFKSLPEQINRLLSRKYAITGTWDDPVVERL